VDEDGRDFVGFSVEKKHRTDFFGKSFGEDFGNFKKMGRNFSEKIVEGKSGKNLKKSRENFSKKLEKTIVGKNRGENFREFFVKRLWEKLTRKKSRKFGEKNCGDSPAPRRGI